MRTKQTRLELLQAIDIYPVTCEALSSGRSDLDVVKACMDGGARIIQLRDKSAARGELFRKAEAFRKITLDSNALLIINDYLDIAQAVDADGVHLGQSDFPLPEARKLFPNGIIGLSTHNPEQAKRAQAEGADYINIGPVFTTKTKEKAHVPVGCALIASAANTATIPFTVMGGITLDNLDQVLAAGARKIAVVTAITQAPNIGLRVKEFGNRIRNFRQDNRIP